MRTIGVLLVLAAFSSRNNVADGGKDLDLIQGTWKVVSIKESDSKKNPPEDFVKSLEFTFKADTMKVMEKSETRVTLKLKLDPTKSPKTIDFIHEDPKDSDKGKTDLGIYKIEGDTLTICADDPGKARPTTFAVKEGTTISVIVLKKKDGFR